MKSTIVSCILLFAIVILLYWPLINTFYQQDEWFLLGLSQGNGISSIFNGVENPLDLIFSKGRLFASLASYLVIVNFPLQNLPFSILAIALHLISTLLVFVLIKKFLNNNFFSFVGATFFAVNAVSHGAITWAFISLNTITSSILVLFAILLFFKYLNNSKTKWLIYISSIIYISLGFKETGFYLFLLFPLSSLLFKKYSVVSFIKTYWFMFLLFILIVVYRVIDLNTRTTSANLYLTGLNENFYSTLLLRLVLYPVTSFSLMFVPGDQFIVFARLVLRQIYPFFAASAQNILIAQTVILDLLAVVLTFLISLSIILLSLKEKLANNKLLVFWVTFTLMSFTPYVLIGKDLSYLESRYYYLSVAGGSIILSWMLSRLWKILGRNIFYIFIAPLITIFLFLHTSTVQKAINEQVRLSSIRKDFIVQLKELVPRLDNKKNTFYISSDQNYWADGNRIPFQQGSGFTLMILYNDSGNIPGEFLRDEYLSEIGSQGYKQILEPSGSKETGDFGFGYFWEEDKLEEAIKTYNLAPESIFRLKYDSKMHKLSKI